jgi:hypothetical protein
VLATEASGHQLTISMNPLWINVTNTNHPLIGTDKIRVVLTPWVTDAPKDARNGYGREIQTIDLHAAGNGRFTGQAQALTVTRGNESSGRTYQVKISVVVNGAWLSDSYDGKKDFLISPLQ